MYGIGDKVQFKGHMGIVVDVSLENEYYVAFFERMENSHYTVTQDGVVWNDTLCLKEEELSPIVLEIFETVSTSLPISRSGLNAT